MISKIINWVKSNQHSIFLAICVILISTISYNLGKLNSNSKTTVKINSGNDVFQASAVQSLVESDSLNTSPSKLKDLRVVASKNSTAKKYHYLWCPGAKKIKDQNKLWFGSSQEAESKGYTLAGNCEF